MEQLGVARAAARAQTRHERIRVLVFTNSLRLGGSERQAVELVRSLDRSRFEPLLACFRRDGPLIRDLPPDLGAIEALPLAAFWKPGVLRQAWRFLQLVRRRRVQVVQCFDFYSNVFAIPLARLAGVPVVIGCRREEGTVRTAAQRRIERWCHRSAHAVVANGEVIARQLVARDGLRPDRVVAIYNGIDIARFDRLATLSQGRHGVAARGPTIAVVANLRPEKGHFVFVEAAERLLQCWPDAEFVIAGDGPERARIAARVASSPAARRIHMIGVVSNVPAFLTTVDMLAVPSVMNEGFPNAAMEAMAGAKPVVATDTGSTGELVVDGVTGYLVPPGEAAPLADRLGRLCSSPDTRSAMGQRGRERVVAHFSTDRMAAGFATLFEHLLAGYA